MLTAKISREFKNSGVYRFISQRRWQNPFSYPNFELDVEEDEIRLLLVKQETEWID